MPYGIPVITEYSILCEECGVKFKKLVHAHLKLHGLTITEYKEKWGFCITQPLEALYIKKLRRHYNKIYNASKYLVSDFAFKKGDDGRKTRIVSEQERIRLASIAVNVQSTEKFRKTISKAAKKVWDRPGYKKKYSKKMKKKYSKDKGFSKRMGEQSSKFWDSHKKATH